AATAATASSWPSLLASSPERPGSVPDSRSDDLAHSIARDARRTAGHTEYGSAKATPPPLPSLPAAAAPNTSWPSLSLAPGHRRPADRAPLPVGILPRPAAAGAAFPAGP